MKYFVMYTSNGELQIPKITEHTDLNSAKSKWHDVCKTLWATKEVESAFVVILDNQMDFVEGDKYKEYIHHDAEPVTPAPESNSEE